jgi:hypothetical protein
MSNPNPVEQLKNEYKAIEDYLKEQNQISLVVDLNKHLRKVLILSAGSYFEHRITKILSGFVQAKSGGDSRIMNFLEKQAISQKYYTLFDWGKKDKPENPGNNATTFFKLFGEDFNEQAKSDVTIANNESEERKAEKTKLNESIKAFIEIGHLRNILVHSNFAEYSYENKTPEEIFTLFQTAEPFLEYLQEKLK